MLSYFSLGYSVAIGDNVMSNKDNQQWTAERVRDKLPSVTVQLDNGELISCVIGGRLLSFAQIVQLKYTADNSVKVFRHYPGVFLGEVAWSTIADVLNRGAYIRL